MSVNPTDGSHSGIYAFWSNAADLGAKVGQAMLQKTSLVFSDGKGIPKSPTVSEIIKEHPGKSIWDKSLK